MPLAFEMPALDITPVPFNISFDMVYLVRLRKMSQLQRSRPKQTLLLVQSCIRFDSLMNAILGAAWVVALVMRR
jgi:hypothetical protein